MSGAEWRPGQGLFARREWTAAAAQLIDGKEYAYISPVLLYDEETLEITGVAMAALVNYPGLLGMYPVHAALATQFLQEKTPMNPVLAALLAGLGLQETATQEQAVSALNALKNKPPVPAALATALKLQPGADEAAALAAVVALGRPDGASTAAMAALQGQLAALTAQINEGKVVAVVDQAVAAGKLLPAQRDWAIGYGKTDLAALQGFISAAPVIPGLAGQSEGRTVPGKTEAAAALSSAEALSVAAAMGIPADAWKAQVAKSAATA